MTTDITPKIQAELRAETYTYVPESSTPRTDERVVALKGESAQSQAWVGNDTVSLYASAKYPGSMNLSYGHLEEFPTDEEPYRYKHTQSVRLRRNHTNGEIDVTIRGYEVRTVLEPNGSTKLVLTPNNTEPIKD